jgi:hypothetical protein
MLMANLPHMISTRNKKNKPMKMIYPQIWNDGSGGKNQTASLKEADVVDLLLKIVRAGDIGPLRKGPDL